MTHGYRTRRLAVDYSIPLVTDVKCAKLLIEAMRLIGCREPPMKTHTDCISSRVLIKFPGFIDVHVHVREPGATHKEDYDSCTAAALAGGVTLICAMPNTDPSVTDKETFQVVSDLAKAGARCDYALFVGATSTNFDTICGLAPYAAALKMYLNSTFTTMKLNDMTVWEKHLAHWPKHGVLCVHAEKQTMGAVILLASLLDRPVHICHVARKEEILMIRLAKERKIKVTCEVCPHHLFLSTDDIDRIGKGRCEVRPVLVSPEDQQALWDNLSIIDIFATDHAPHTHAEKCCGNPPPGFPGLETILPLLLNAVNEGRMTVDELVDKFHRNPKRIFHLPEQMGTYVEVDMNEDWIIPEKTQYSKAQWTPFAGMKVKGRVHRVVLRGEVAYIEGEVLVQPGFGQNVREWTSKYLTSTFNGSIDDLSRGSNHEPSIREPLETDVRTNDIFTQLLSNGNDNNGKQRQVHFSPHQILRPHSPALRPRLDSTGAVASREILAVIPAGIPPARSLSGKDILSVDMFTTKDMLNDIFNLAQWFKVQVVKGRPLDGILRGKVMASMFYEVSTRTCCSFAAAMQRLGGRVIYMDATSSSVKKGETLEDSVAVMSGYADVIVLRHPHPGAASKAAHHTKSVLKRPLINAGDGVGEHPTQALLDVFTIREEIGTVNGLTITIAGDLKHGRTVHSLARLLTLYVVNIIYVSPKGLEMPKEVMDFVAQKGISQKVTDPRLLFLKFHTHCYIPKIKGFRHPRRSSPPNGRPIHDAHPTRTLQFGKGI